MDELIRKQMRDVEKKREKNMSETVSRMENVGDTISRQSATTIPVMPKEHRHYQTNNLDDAYEQGWNDLQECIENLPPVQSELEDKIRAIGYTGKEGRIYIGGRLFAVRELAQ